MNAVRVGNATRLVTPDVVARLPFLQELAQDCRDLGAACADLTDVGDPGRDRSTLEQLDAALAWAAVPPVHYALPAEEPRRGRTLSALSLFGVPAAEIRALRSTTAEGSGIPGGVQSGNV